MQTSIQIQIKDKIVRDVTIQTENDIRQRNNSCSTEANVQCDSVRITKKKKTFYKGYTRHFLFVLSCICFHLVKYEYFQEYTNPNQTSKWPKKDASNNKTLKTIISEI